ncbi:glycosyl transferase GT2 family [Eubacterium limosum]|nr:glycosyl transferase GT2 family [Eubacterium limosum]
MQEYSYINEEFMVEYPSFSVAMCVYAGDSADNFNIAFDSVLKQTIKPDEIVLIIDGPIPNTIQVAINKYINICNNNKIVLRVIRLKKNRGLGNALRIAIEKCHNEWIARMDSDDIAVSDRFEQQLNCILKNKDVDIIGGDINEFIGTDKNIVGKRSVPQDNNEIKQYMRTRCALNHMTVMYKKSVVMAAGNYMDWFWNEDYYLWIRMMEQGCQFANTGTVLVNVRVGKEMYQRRGGMKYFQSEMKLQKYMLEKKIIDLPIFITNAIKRMIIQVLIPSKIRGWAFRTFARSKL